MAVNVSADQTATGWRIELQGVEAAVIETDGPRLSIVLAPDDDDTQKPLAVSLGEPA
jgi:hypothetical protein